jgi:hypothetical protein
VVSEIWTTNPIAVVSAVFAFISFTNQVRAYGLGKSGIKSVVSSIEL